MKGDFKHQFLLLVIYKYFMTLFTNDFPIDLFARFHLGFHLVYFNIMILNQFLYKNFDFRIIITNLILCILSNHLCNIYFYIITFFFNWSSYNKFINIFFSVNFLFLFQNKFIH
jgi:hypothetical protein